MKQLKLTFLFTILMSMVGVKVTAHDFEVANTDGVTIYYNITSDTEVAVGCRGKYSSSYSNEYSGSVVIPATVTYSGKTYNVTSIDVEAFRDCTNLTSTTIPNSVTSIGENAFRDCSAMTTFIIPNSVTSIGGGAFYGTAWYDNQPDGLVYAGKVAYIYKGTMPANTSITIEEGTLGIAYGTFMNCSNLISIEIPNSVTRIGERAFNNCTGLTTVTIPNGVTSIGGYAFDGCSGLTTITIPNSVSSIGDYAFSYTAWYDNQPDGLVYAGKVAYRYRGTMPPNTSITIKEGTLGIAAYAFIGFSDLTSVTIPNSVTNIGYAAFSDCSGLTSVTIPNSVMSIGDLAFSGCSGLTSITIPNSVTNIGLSAFNSCSNLTSVTIPSSVTRIGGSAFSKCSSLTSVTIKKETPSFIFNSYTFSNRANATLYVPVGSKAAYQAADYWKEFKEIVEFLPIINFSDANVKAICVANWDTNGDGELSETEAAAVTNLGSVFKENTTITSFDELSYFTGLTSIGNEAFAYCSSLTSVSIPNSVTSIGDDVFFGCSSLTSVTIPNSVTSIGNEAFYGTAWYNNQPDGLVYAGKVAYTYKGTMPTNTSITIEDGTLGIASEAFLYKSGLTSVTIPNSVTSIGEWAFASSGLTSVTISNSVTTIGAWAFKSTPWYDNQPDGLIYVGKVAYKYKGTMPTNTNITIEDGIVSLSPYAFEGCSGLASITIPNSVTSIGNYAFYGCWFLTSVNIPNSVTSIGNYVFFECARLTSVTIPNSVTNIGSYAFYRCSGLASVTIPNSVTNIGSYAFGDCSDLTSVTIKKETPLSINSNTFSNRTNATLYVPAGSKAAYQAADYWKEFKEIVEITIDDDTPDTDINSMNNVIYLNKVEASTGSQINLSIRMKNAAAIRGFQFDLYLPDGVTVVKSAKGKIVGSLSDGRLPEDDEHTLTLSEQSDGAIRFLCGSLYDETFTGNDGEIATLTVKIAENMSDGNYPIILRNMKLTETDINNYYQTDYVKSTLTIKSYTLGDINSDQKIDVSDYIGIANHILGNTPDGFVVKAADVNVDGNIDVSDYIGVANIILTGSIYGTTNNARIFLFEEDVEQEMDPQ